MVETQAFMTLIVRRNESQPVDPEQENPPGLRALCVLRDISPLAGNRGSPRSYQFL